MVPFSGLPGSGFGKVLCTGDGSSDFDPSPPFSASSTAIPDAVACLREAGGGMGLPLASSWRNWQAGLVHGANLQSTFAGPVASTRTSKQRKHTTHIFAAIYLPFT
jgi:hypothetical protein